MQHKGLFAVLLLIAAALIFTGCIAGPKRVTYNVLAGSEITIDTAMSAWGDYVAQFHPPVSQEQAVADAYNKAQAAEEAAIDAAMFTIAVTASGSTNGIPDANSRYTAAAAQAASALSDLLKLLRQFGVKI